jgi:hypothetical protein
VKRSDLKELIREEIKKVLSEDMGLSSKYPAGTYKIEYIVASEDGGPDYPESDEVTIDADETYTDVFGNEYSEFNFWEEKLEKKYGYLKFPIYKFTKATKIG